MRMTPLQIFCIFGNDSFTDISQLFCLYCDKITLQRVLEGIWDFWSSFLGKHFSTFITIKGGFRTAATSRTERFVIIVNGWTPLTVITKRSILDVAAVLDPPLTIYHIYSFAQTKIYYFVYINICAWSKSFL